MSKHQGRRISRHTVRQLRSGVVADVPDALAGLLAAAAAPPHDGELDGEQAAVAAFLDAAHHPDVPRPRSPSVNTTSVAMKVATAVAAICTVSGVAAVAATGHLTLPGGGMPPPATSSRPAVSSFRAVISAPVSTVSSGAAGSATARQSSPSPSLVGLCHAYTAGAGSEHGKALDNPAFSALITAAGGRTGVDAYCAALSKEASPAPKEASPAHATGSNKPEQKTNANHPTGPPGHATP